jgi:hypothetical protein
MLDTYALDGKDWAIRHGFPKNKISTQRVSDHVHVISWMFDDMTLAAIVTDGAPHHTTKVTQTSRCTICQPITYTMTWTYPSGEPGKFVCRDRVKLDRAVRHAIRIGATDIEVMDDLGKDVTVEIPAACTA